MPDPVTSNPWAGNPWTRDLDRETAADAERVGSTWGWAAAHASRELASQSPPGQEDAAPVEAAEDVYQSLTADWPEVPPLIGRHITGDDFGDVFDVWYKYWRNPGNPDDHVQCFDFAQYQLRIAGFRGTGDGQDQTTYFQLFVETFDEASRIDVTDVATTAEAVRYVKEQVRQGVPVMTGIRLLHYRKRPNPDLTTNHFVVIVGMGQEPDGPYGARYYFSYYDYLRSETLRFYLYNFPTLALHSLIDESGASRGEVPSRRVSQIRRTVRR